MSIPDWLSWNQNSVFESQSEIDTWQGGICKKLQVVEGQKRAAEKGVFGGQAVGDIERREELEGSSERKPGGFFWSWRRRFS